MITWLVSADETPSDVEYFGQHVIGAQHGLCKDKAVNEPYAQTTAEIMEAISSPPKQQSAKSVYNKLTAELEIDAAPRNAAWCMTESIAKLGKIARITAPITAIHSVMNFSASSTWCRVTQPWQNVCALCCSNWRTSTKRAVIHRTPNTRPESVLLQRSQRQHFVIRQDIQPRRDLCDSSGVQKYRSYLT